MRSLSFDRSRRIAISLTTLLALLPALAVGQGSRENFDAKLRADCRLAAQTLETGHPSPLWGRAVETIRRCDQTAGAALAVVWRQPPADSASLEDLFFSSARVRDQRIFLATMAMARDVTASWWPRATALRVLAAYVDPLTLVKPDYLRPAPDSVSLFSVVSHFYQINGSKPLPGDALLQIKGLVEALALSDPDPGIRFAGRYLGRALHMSLR